MSTNEKNIKHVALVWFAAVASLGYTVKLGLIYFFPETEQSYIDQIINYIPATTTYSGILEPIDVTISIVMFSLTFPLVLPRYIFYLRNNKSVFDHKHLKPLFILLAFACPWFILFGIDLGSNIGFAKIFYALASAGFLGCVTFFFVIFQSFTFVLAYSYCVVSSS